MIEYASVPGAAWQVFHRARRFMAGRKDRLFTQSMKGAHWIDYQIRGMDVDGL